jgi:hypothetical protein
LAPFVAVAAPCFFRVVEVGRVAALTMGFVFFAALAAADELFLLVDRTGRLGTNLSSSKGDVRAETRAKNRRQSRRRTDSKHERQLEKTSREKPKPNTDEALG